MRIRTSPLILLSAFALAPIPVMAAQDNLAPTERLGAPKEIAPLSMARIQEVASFLTAERSNVCPPYSDRGFWEKVSNLSSAKEVLEAAEKLRGTEPPVLTEELFNDFSKTGLRRPYQLPAADRTNRLHTLVLAECMAPSEDRLAQIVREVELVLTEPTWVVPAHAKRYKNWHEARTYIDLAASGRGWTLANIDWLLADRLPADTRARLRKEVDERVLQPWLKSIRQGNVGELHWMKAPMNWSAVCNSGVLGSALLLIDDPMQRAEFIVGWEELNPFFLGGFTPDGYCAEGVGYWNYGFGHFLIASQLVHHVTGGRVDALESDHVRQIMNYGPGFEIDNNIFPPFSDTTLGTRPDRHLLDFAAVRFSIGQVRGKPAFKGHSTLGGRIHVALFDLAIQRPPTAEASGSPLPLRTWFPFGGALICRGSQPGKGLAVALKGGHNDEPHNHNDLGSFMVIADGAVGLSELGRDDYVAGTFGPNRYSSGIMNSFGHSVPRVAGLLQSTGKKARAETVRTEFTPERDVWQMDLSSAYDAPGLRELTRTFIFTRANGGSLEIIDEVTFSDPQSFGVAFTLLPGQRWVEEGGDAHLIEGGEGRVRVRVTTESGELMRSEDPVLGIMAGAAPKGLRVGFDLKRDSATTRIRTLITPVPPAS